MNNEFFEYIKPTSEEFNSLWSNALFTFDTNILLNFYRYKEDTTNEFLSVLHKLEGRIFITHQVGNEYFSDRVTVILEQEKAYDDLKKDYNDKIEQPLKNQRKHPYIKQELLIELESIGKRIIEDLLEKSKEHTKRLSDDDIMQKIVSLFSEKVTENFKEAELVATYAEGEKRYEKKIPPGYEDKKKPDNSKYGDLVLWKQLIAKSIKEQKDIIFVTDDQKEDWWYIHSGKTIGPRPELQREFFSETSKKIYFYTAERFYQYASEFLKEDAKQAVIDEARDIREEEVLKIDKLKKDYWHEVVTEEELLKQLIFFRDKVLEGGYVGLKRFITEYLANQNYEINHSYAIINKLEEKGLIRIFNHFDDRLNYSVKVIEILT